MKKLICIGFVLLILGCNKIKKENAINVTAALPSSYKLDDGLKVITILFDKNDKTIATLYGNDAAIAQSLVSDGVKKPGAVFTLITWEQEANPEWFGGINPGKAISVEEVRVSLAESGIVVSNYKRYEDDSSLANTESTLKSRIDYILSQKLSIMP